MFGMNVRCWEELVMRCRDHLCLMKNTRPYNSVLCIALCLIVVLVLAGSGIFFVSKSKAADEVISFKYYTSVEVEYGDTLWGIASNYRTEEYRSLLDYIEEIKTLNGLQSDMIRSGQFLVIPYYSSE